MNLVKTNNSSYINMDTIESVFEEYLWFSNYKKVRCISGETYDISEEAYETILKYGKAKI